MAPMTRSRARPGGTPSEPMVRHDAQRAQAGLIVTEGAAPSRTGRACLRMPGLCLEGHVGPWRPITGAVHAAGSRIFLQLMHLGRLAHSANVEGRPPPAIRGPKGHGPLRPEDRPAVGRGAEVGPGPGAARPCPGARRGRRLVGRERAVSQR